MIGWGEALGLLQERLVGRFFPVQHRHRDAPFRTDGAVRPLPSAGVHALPCSGRAEEGHGCRQDERQGSVPDA